MWFDSDKSVFRFALIEGSENYTMTTQTNQSLKMYELSETFCGEGFVDEVFGAYTNAVIKQRLSKADILFNLRELFNFMRSRSMDAEKNGYPHYSFRAQKPDRLREAILSAASSGLRLAPKFSDVHFECKSPDENTLPRIDIVVGINGYTGLIYSNPRVRYLECNAIYLNDSFRWHGDSEKPVYIHDPAKADKRSIIGSFATVGLDDGFTVSVYVDQEALEYVRGQQLLDARQRGFTSPWETFYAKCAANMALRRMWRSHGRRICPQAYSLLEERNEEDDVLDISVDDFNAILKSEEEKA
jgi:hypothetical protein